MLTLTKPEIDGRTEFRSGTKITINHQFSDGTTILERLHFDDASIAVKQLEYTNKDRPTYMYSKYYLSNNYKDEVIVERVFKNESTRSWFGIADRKFGMFHFYPRLRSKFPIVRGSNEDIGILYWGRYDQLIVYGTDDSEMLDNCVLWMFNNRKDVIDYIEDMKQINEKYKESTYLGIPKFYSGSSAENSGMVILEL